MRGCTMHVVSLLHVLTPSRMLCPLSIVDDSDTTHVQPAVLGAGAEKHCLFVPLFVVLTLPRRLAWREL
jgi:hypothetical protein